MRAKVCSPEGYLVMWPNLLTDSVSAAKIKPFFPPLIIAIMFEQGSVIWAIPEANATNLIRIGVRINFMTKGPNLIEWNAY